MGKELQTYRVHDIGITEKKVKRDPIILLVGFVFLGGYEKRTQETGHGIAKPII